VLKNNVNRGASAPPKNKETKMSLITEMNNKELKKKERELKYFIEKYTQELNKVQILIDVQEKAKSAKLYKKTMTEFYEREGK
jgi:hypothetical protein